MGSSPLARGPRTGADGAGAAMGLIPARAGTTRGIRYVFQVVWAHPRSRGDHQKFRHPLSERAGSSPLARGPHLLDNL